MIAYPDLPLVPPSEAQWEYSCRAGTTTPSTSGNNITREQVNYDSDDPNAGGKTDLYRQETVPVASMPPNPWGLYEMHGNVWEWCQITGTITTRALRPTALRGKPRCRRGPCLARRVLGRRRVRSAVCVPRRDLLDVCYGSDGFRCARVRDEPSHRESGTPACCVSTPANLRHAAHCLRCRPS